MNVQELILIVFILISFGTFLLIARQQYISGEYKKYRDTSVDPLDTKYFFSGMPEGTLSVDQPFASAFALMLMLIGVMGSGWIMVNVPELSAVGSVYAVFAVFVMSVLLIEEVSPELSRTTAAIVTGFGRWDMQLIVGIVISMPFIVFSLLGVRYQVFQAEGMPIASFIITVIMVPLVEESLFRGVLVASVSEFIGSINGITVSSVLFSFYHVLVYEAAPIPLAFALGFGVLAALADLRYKSLIPGLIGHMIVNFAAFAGFMFMGG